jgi:ABC-type transport system involved in cytochrome c biogenesis ATPase subunit
LKRFLQNMEFELLLTGHDIHRLFQTQSIESRIEICCGVLTSSVKVVVVNGTRKAYNLDNASMMWRCSEDDTTLNELIGSVVRNFLSASIAYLKHINPKALEKYMVTKEDLKFFAKIETEGFFGNISSWVSKLVVSHIRFDEDFGGIHFLNGRYDLQSGTFETRHPLKHFITRCIDYDYVPFNSEQEWCDAMLDIENFLLTIVREREALYFICSTIGKSLINGNIKACDLMYLYGEGGCGKTTLYYLLQKTLTDVYVYSITADAFDSAHEAHRAIGGVNSSHRLIFWNEPDPSKKKKSSFIKQLVDGVISIKHFGESGNFKTPIYAKLFVTANYIVELDSGDSGVTRRFNYYNFKNRFVNPQIEQPNPGNYIFEANDIGTRDYILSTQQKMALFHYLVYFINKTLSRPYQIVSGKFILSLNKFNDYFLAPNEDETVALEDYIFVLGKAFKFFDFGTAKEVLGRMKKETPYLIIHEERFAINKKGQRSKGCIEARFSAWAEEQFTRCKTFSGANFDFNFSELPPRSEHIESHVSDLVEGIQDLGV